MNPLNAPTNGKRLLLVDDDRLVLAMLADGLGHAGYSVTSVESAEDAQACLAGGVRPDLVVLDVRMPGQGGLYLAQRLRELDHIPFMMLSAYSDAPTVEQANLAGAMGYAVKPIDTVQLVPAIEAALARANELSALRTNRHQLQEALDGDRDIGVAVGITMVQHRLKRADAFEMLRKTARNQRCKLSSLAAQVIAAGETLTL